MPGLVAVYQISVAFAWLFLKSYRFIPQGKRKTTKHFLDLYMLVESNIEIISAVHKMAKNINVDVKISWQKMSQFTQFATITIQPYSGEKKKQNV